MQLYTSFLQDFVYIKKSFLFVKFYTTSYINKKIENKNIESKQQYQYILKDTFISQSYK